jgi:hypothetical protein
MSHWRFTYGKFDDPSEHFSTSLNQEVLYSIGRIESNTKEVLNYRDAFKEKAIFLRYENFYRDFTGITEPLSKFFEIEITDATLADLKSRFSMEQMRTYQLPSKHNMHIQTTTGIHRYHIYTGEIGIWRKLLDPSDHDEFEERLEDLRHLFWS